MYRKYVYTFIYSTTREKQTDKFLYLLYIFSTFYYPFTVYFVLFFLSSICRLQEIENFSSLCPVASSCTLLPTPRRTVCPNLIPKILLKLIFPTIGRLYSVSRYKQTLSKFQPYLPANKPISHKSTVYLSFREREKKPYPFGQIFFTRYFYSFFFRFVVRTISLDEKKERKSEEKNIICGYKNFPIKSTIRVNEFAIYKGVVFGCLFYN